MVRVGGVDGGDVVMERIGVRVGLEPAMGEEEEDGMRLLVVAETDDGGGVTLLLS